MSQISEDLTKGSLLSKNIIYSLIGYSVPVLVAIFTIPILLNSLGIEGFGILTIAWMITGYFSLLDLGIGRALTKILSERLGREEIEDIPSLIWTAMLLAIFVGFFGSILIVLSSSSLVTNIFKISSDMYTEVIKSFYILAISIPLVICNGTLKGVLESYQRFDLINILRIPIGSLTFLAPIFVLPFSEKISHIVISLVIVRSLEFLINLYFCKKVVNSILSNFRIEVSHVLRILSFGGWISISNVITPIMVYLDRFLIGSIISVGAISYYATSYEIIQRLMVIPGAIVGVLFPAFGVLISTKPKKAAKIFSKGIKYTFLTIFPIVFAIFVFAEEGLDLWLGKEFADKGTIVLKLLIIGALINSFAYFPFAMLHASGRPDLTAKLHLIETPIYIVIAWTLINIYGIEGAAAAWALKTTLDTIILFIMVQKTLNISFPATKIFFIVLLVCLLFLISFLYTDNFYFKLKILAVTLLIFSIFSWKILLDASERFFILSFVTKYRKIFN